MTDTRPTDTAKPAERAKGPTRIQSVSRAARLLLHVASFPEGRTAKEAAEAFGMPLPTAYHLLNTLTAEGLLSKDSQRRYSMGPKVGVMANAFLRDARVPEWLMAPLEQMAAATGETAYLATWRDNDVRVLATVEGAQAVRVAGLTVGTSGDAHARASGKLLLAFAAPQLREDYLGTRPLRRRTAHTITRRKDLEKEFAAIAARGYAFDEEEFAEGVRCVAVPVFDEGALLAAYTISAPTQRFLRNRDQIVATALDAARAAVTTELSDDEDSALS